MSSKVDLRQFNMLLNGIKLTLIMCIICICIESLSYIGKLIIIDMRLKVMKDKGLSPTPTLIVTLHRRRQTIYEP